MKAVLLAAIVFFTASLAQATCATPSGVAGQIQWLSGASKIEFCDGTTWQDTSNGTVSSCSGTTAGTIQYFSGSLNFCDGTNWISMKGMNEGSASGVSAGTYLYDTVLNLFKFSDGTSWFAMLFASQTLPTVNMMSVLGWTDSSNAAQSVSWSAPSSGTLECRFDYFSVVGSDSYSLCNTGITFSQNSTYPNGTYQLQIRSKDSGGAVTGSATYSVYMHDTVNGAATCPHPYTDAQVETAVRSYLTAGSSGAFTSASTVTPPRVQLVTADSVVHEVRSLRRAFNMSADRNFVWVKRNYPSTYAANIGVNVCTVQNFQVGNNQGNLNCDVVATNSDFEAVCLQWNGSNFVLAQYENAAVAGKAFNSWGDAQHNDSPTDCHDSSAMQTLLSPTDVRSIYRAKGRSPACVHQSVFPNHTIYYIPD